MHLKCMVIENTSQSDIEAGNYIVDKMLFFSTYILDVITWVIAVTE